MAIARDSNQSPALTSVGASTLSWTHTNTGSGLVLWVGVYNQDTTDSVTTVTYNASSMTKTGNTLQIGTNFLNLWLLENAPSGANTVLVTRTGTTGRLGGRSASYTGTNATGQPDPAGSDGEKITGAGTVTMTRITTANNDWAVVLGYDDDGGNISAGTNSTAVSASSFLMLFDNSGHGPITPAGSFSMSIVKGSGSSQFGGIMAGFEPTQTAVANGNFFTFM